jgi:uncharacterized protein YbgA (DUF1722 family)/uncharacterized protein YbbK (DUF523 family)
MKIGVSECLLGHKCRYDGSGAKDRFVVDELSSYFELIPYCPEAKIFGTPRETIRLVEFEEGIKVMTNETKKDVTQELTQVSSQFAQKAKSDTLCGFVLKSKSPTCGLERVKVYQKVNAPSEKKGVGVFAKELKKLYPYLPIEEEGRLNDPWLKENFIMQVFAYNDLYEFLGSRPDFKTLVQFHTSYKYLIYAKSQNSYKHLGSIVANHDKKEIKEVLKEYEKGFLEAINEKGSIGKTYNVLLHIFGYFKKFITKEEKEDILNACEEYKQQIIPLIAVVKLLNLYAKRFDIAYLKDQKFLKPYPKEFALRSDIKAYK